VYFGDLKEANMYGVRNISSDHGSNSLRKLCLICLKKKFSLKQNSVAMEAKSPYFSILLRNKCLLLFSKETTIYVSGNTLS
jgi:hypothetical protein